jgi:hypothetical protein
MRSTLRQAADLYLPNAGLFTAIVLTTILPCTALSNWVALHSALPYDFWLSLGFGLPRRIDWPLDALGAAGAALAAGAIIDVLVTTKNGGSPTYRYSMAAAIRAFGWLYVANFIVSAITVIAAFALIIPAFIVVVRYAFVPCVVVVEGARPGEALRRSARLTKGIRWRIFGVGALVWGVLGAVAVVIHLRVTGLHAAGDAPIATFLAHMVGDGILSIASVFGIVAVFVLYWEAKTAPRKADQDATTRAEPSFEPM